MNKPSQTPNVVFVTRHLEHASGGFGRYEQWLLTELRQMCEVESRAINSWPLPDCVGRVFKFLGLDLKAVLDGHPSRVPAPRDGRIFHLSNQHLAASFLWQRYQGPKIVTVHDVIPLIDRPSRSLRPTDLVNRFLAWQWAQGLKRADLIIAVSHWTRKDLEQHLGISPTRIRVVYQAADMERLRPAHANGDIPDFGIGEETPFLLYVGSLHPRKDVPTLVQALALARRELPDLTLVLAGSPRIDSDAPSVRAIRNEINRLGLSQVVKTTGHISDEVLGRLYRRALATVLPSRAEGFGLPILEAMACGCPVIGAAATSLPEVIANAGILFQPGNADDLAAAIIKLATEPELSTTLRSAGLARAEQFSTRRRAEETMAVYKEAIQLQCSCGDKTKGDSK